MVACPQAMVLIRAVDGSCNARARPPSSNKKEVGVNAPKAITPPPRGVAHVGAQKDTEAWPRTQCPAGAICVAGRRADVAAVRQKSSSDNRALPPELDARARRTVPCPILTRGCSSC